MNITAHQEKEKNDETRMSKRRAGEDRIQVSNFKEVVWCSSAIIQEAVLQKNEGECLGYLGPLGRLEPFQ